MLDKDDDDIIIMGQKAGTDQPSPSTVTVAEAEAAISLLPTGNPVALALQAAVDWING